LSQANWFFPRRKIAPTTNQPADCGRRINFFLVIHLWQRRKVKLMAGDGFGWWPGGVCFLYSGGVECVSASEKKCTDEKEQKS
jgi:hypothetical protein